MRENFRNDQRLALNLSSNSVSPIARASPPFANLQDFEKKRNSHPIISERTSRMSINKSSRALYQNLNRYKIGNMEGEYKLDENGMGSFTADADSD